MEFATFEASNSTFFHISFCQTVSVQKGSTKVIINVENAHIGNSH